LAKGFNNVGKLSKVSKGNPSDDVEEEWLRGLVLRKDVRVSDRSSAVTVGSVILENDLGIQQSLNQGLSAAQISLDQGSMTQPSVALTSFVEPAPLTFPVSVEKSFVVGGRSTLSPRLSRSTGNLKDMEGSSTQHDTVLPSSIPEQYHLVRKAFFPEGDKRDWAYIQKEKMWLKTEFPSLIPAGRQDVLLLDRWLESMLLEQASTGDQTPRSVVQDAQKVYSMCFHEVVRQVSVHCVERGHLIMKIWQTYLDLFNRMMDLNNKEVEAIRRECERRTQQLQEQLEKERVDWSKSAMELKEQIIDLTTENTNLHDQIGPLRDMIRQRDGEIERLRKIIQELLDQIKRQNALELERYEGEERARRVVQQQKQHKTLTATALALEDTQPLKTVQLEFKNADGEAVNIAVPAGVLLRSDELGSDYFNGVLFMEEHKFDQARENDEALRRGVPVEGGFLATVHTEEEGIFPMERDPTYFPIIVEFMTTGVLRCPLEREVIDALKEEGDFYQIDGLLQALDVKEQDLLALEAERSLRDKMQKDLEALLSEIEKWKKMYTDLKAQYLHDKEAWGLRERDLLEEIERLKRAMAAYMAGMSGQDQSLHDKLLALQGSLSALNNERNELSGRLEGAFEQMAEAGLSPDDRTQSGAAARDRGSKSNTHGNGRGGMDGANSNKWGSGLNGADGLNSNGMNGNGSRGENGNGSWGENGNGNGNGNGGRLVDVETQCTQTILTGEQLEAAGMAVDTGSGGSSGPLNSAGSGEGSHSASGSTPTASTGRKKGGHSKTRTRGSTKQRDGDGNLRSAEEGHGKSKTKKGLTVPNYWQMYMRSMPKGAARCLTLKRMKQMIIDCFVEKLKQDENAKACGTASLEFPPYVCDYFYAIYGVKKIVQTRLKEFIVTTNTHIADPRVLLFGRFAGLTDPLPKQCLDFMLGVLRGVYAEEMKHISGGSNWTEDPKTYNTWIPLQHVQNAIQLYFSDTPVFGKIKASVKGLTTSRNSKGNALSVSLDEFLPMLVQLWIEDDEKSAVLYAEMFRAEDDGNDMLDEHEFFEVLKRLGCENNSSYRTKFFEFCKSVSDSSEFFLNEEQFVKFARLNRINPNSLTNYVDLGNPNRPKQQQLKKGEDISDGAALASIKGHDGDGVSETIESSAKGTTAQLLFVVT
jgi:hypothetical protein